MTLVCLFVPLCYSCGISPRRHFKVGVPEWDQLIICLLAQLEQEFFGAKSLGKQQLIAFYSPIIALIDQFINLQSYVSSICVLGTTDRLRECRFCDICHTSHEGDFVF